MSGLQRQVVDLPITGGIDQKTDPNLSVELVDALNCRYVKTGGLRKRRGTTCIATSNAAFAPSGGPASLPTPSKLATYGKELIRIGGNGVYAYGQANSTTDWIFRGYASGTLPSQNSPFGSLQGAQSIQVANAYGSQNQNHLVYTAASLAVAPTGVFTTVVDVANGEEIYSQYLLGSLNGHVPKLVTIGTKVVAIYRSGTNTLVAITYDADTGLWNTTPTTLSSATITSDRFFDVTVNASNTFTVVYQDSAKNIIVKSFNSSLSNTQTSTVAATLTNAAVAVAVYFKLGDSALWVAYSDSNSTRNVIVYSRTPTTLAAISGPSGDLDFTTPTGLATCCLSFMSLSATSAAVFWACSAGAAARPVALRWNTIDTSGTLGYPDIAGISQYRQLIRAMPVAKPFIMSQGGNDRGLIPVAYGGSVFIVEPDVASSVANYRNPARIVGTVLPRQTGDIVTGPPGRSDLSLSASVPIRNSGAIAFGMARNSPLLVGGATTFEQIACTAILDKEASASVFISTPPSAVEAGNLLVTGAGAVLYTDKQTTAELGFALAPPVSGNFEFYATASGGAGTPKAYQYKMVYELTDRQGNVHRSSPSAAVSVSVDFAAETVSLTLPYLTLTNNVYDVRNIRICIYRTVGNGSIFYYVDTVQNLPKLSIGAYTDNSLDATISVNAELYTTGGVAPNVMPSSAGVVLQWQGCLVAMRTPDDKIWFGKQLIDTEGPAFMDEGVLQPFAGGPVWAGAVLDDKLIVFKADSIWVIVGTPPGDDGDVSGIQAPQVIASDVGCKNPCSVVSTPDGIIFQAPSSKLYLLTRSLQVTCISQQIEASLHPQNAKATPNGFAITSACLVPYDNLIRFTRRYDFSEATNALDYDYYHGTFQKPVWTRSSYVNANLEGAVTTPYAGCVWNNAWCYIDNNGYLYQENIDGTQWLDYWDVTHASYVASQFTLSWAKLTGAQAYKRLWRVQVLGAALTKSSLKVDAYPSYNTGATPQSRTSSYSVAQTVMQEEMHIVSQKTDSMQLVISDVANGVLADWGTGEGLRFSAVTLVFGQKTGAMKLPAAQKG